MSRTRGLLAWVVSQFEDHPRWLLAFLIMWSLEEIVRLADVAFQPKKRGPYKKRKITEK